MTNSADPDQELVWKQSDLGLYRLLGPTCRETKKNHGNVFILAIFIQFKVYFQFCCRSSYFFKSLSNATTGGAMHFVFRGQLFSVFVIDVTLCDQVHDVETVHSLCRKLKTSLNLV